MGKWKVVKNVEKKVAQLLFACTNTAQKMKFSIKDFFRKCDQIRRTADLVTFTEEILNGKINLLYREKYKEDYQRVCKLLKPQNIYRRFASLMKNSKMGNFCTKFTIRHRTWWCIISGRIHFQYNAM